MDTAIHSFEPKLKAVKLNHGDEEALHLSQRGQRPQTHLRKPFFQVAFSHRHEMMCTEKREVELQGFLKGWYSIVCH